MKDYKSLQKKYDNLLEQYTKLSANYLKLVDQSEFVANKIEPPIIRLEAGATDTVNSCNKSIYGELKRFNKILGNVYFKRKGE